MIVAIATFLALASGAAATHDVAPAPDIPFTSAESPFGVTTRQRTGGILVETVASDSKSVGASLFEPLEETYASECFVDYDEDTGEPITEPCEESCGGYSYFLNGYVMVGDEKEVRHFALKRQMRHRQLTLRNSSLPCQGTCSCCHWTPT